MKILLERLKIAGRLAWCALVHGMERHRGGWRCLRCEPIRHHKQMGLPLRNQAAVQAMIQEELAARYGAGLQNLPGER